MHRGSVSASQTLPFFNIRKKSFPNIYVMKGYENEKKKDHFFLGQKETLGLLSLRRDKHRKQRNYHSIF